MKALIRPPLEWREQEALFTWAAFHTSKEPRLALLYAIPNGELRDKRTAAKLMKMGVQAGVPDIHFPIAIRPYHGLWIEMKRTSYTGHLVKAQAAWHAQLLAQGHAVSVCAGWVEAVHTLCSYLGREELACHLS